MFMNATVKNPSVLVPKFPICWWRRWCALLNFFFLHVDEDDLPKVIQAIQPVNHVGDLGLGLGVRWSTIERIRKENPSVKDQKIQVIYHWLTRTDIVRDKRDELPTWGQLAEAVEGENTALSESIQHKYCQWLVYGKLLATIFLAQ